MKQRRIKSESGFSLIELMIVLIITGILAAFILPSLRNNSGDGKKVIGGIERSLQERRASAIRLNQANAQGTRSTSPVVISFNDLATTAELKIDGADANRDGIEDLSGVSLTRFNEGSGAWNYAYEGLPLQIPSGWAIVSNAADLGAIPTVPNSQLVTTIGFDEAGKPVGTPAVTPVAGRDEAPFFVVYARDTKATNIAVAVAIHQSGLIEKWTYNLADGIWTGNGGRQ